MSAVYGSAQPGIDLDQKGIPYECLRDPNTHECLKWDAPESHPAAASRDIKRDQLVQSLCAFATRAQGGDHISIGVTAHAAPTTLAIPL